LSHAACSSSPSFLSYGGRGSRSVGRVANARPAQPSHSFASLMDSTKLKVIFNQLKQLLTPYEKYFENQKNTDTTYDLWTKKSISLNKRKPTALYFTGLMIHKQHVGFYFMPIYIDPTLKNHLPEEILPLLKGKSCFIIKKLTPELIKQMTQLLDIGYTYYKKQGWL